jgi:integrase
MSIYKRGAMYSFNLWFRGRHVQGSTGTSNRKTALDVEAAVRLKLTRNEWDLEPKQKRDPSLKELFDTLEQHFRHGPKWGPKHESNLRMLRAAFPASLKSSELKEDHIEACIARKLRKKRKPATVNRVTGLLKEAYKLAKLEPPCTIRHISEKGNTRRGFFEPGEFERLLEHLPADLHDFCRFAYWTGWRKNEIASLTWGDVESDMVRLRDVHSKNGNPRAVPLNVGELRDVVERRRKLRRSKFNSVDELLFHRNGKRVQEFRKSWRRACKQAGIAGKLFHDFRRTAVRSMIRAGVPQSIAMQVSGHETVSMFQRYNIGNDDDLREAMRRTEVYHQTNAAKVTPMSVSVSQ